MVDVNYKAAVTEVVETEPEKFVLELTRDEAEAVLATVGFNTPGGDPDFDTGDIYTALRIALGYSYSVESKYVVKVSDYGWSTVVKLRNA